MEDIYQNDRFDSVEELNYKLEKIEKTSNQTKIILKLYYYIGIITFVIGGLWFVFSYYEFKLTSKQTTILLISGVGILISIFASLTRQLLVEKQKNLQVQLFKANQYSSFMNNWIILEKTLNRLLDSSKLSEHKFAISKNLEILHKEGKISNRDYLNIEKALSIRNAILHGGINVPIEEVKRNSEKIEILTDKLIDQM